MVNPAASILAPNSKTARRTGPRRRRPASAFCECVYAVLMSPDSLSEWQTLLSMQAGAAATLTGLVFVAASINLTKIVATPLLTVRVVESLVQFLQVFFVCSVMIVPHQSSFALAIEILVVSFLS